jgi:sterol desaturase/sphingolipid hydroxylase (fatty acid hydroxylase superfamily)
VLEAFYLTLVGVIAYQCVGVALFLPFEIAFPKADISVTERADGFIFLLATAPVTAAVGALISWLQPLLGITPVSLHFSPAPFFAAIAAALWVDLQFYVIHRIEHRFFWRFHAVHHSIENLSAANSYHHWSEALMGLTIAIPLMFLDVHIGPTLGILSFLFTYQQFYIHSASRPHFGPLRCLLVDNRYHRIHHSVQPEHHDKNFGAMTPLWDWLFGTLYLPKSDEWPDVGLDGVDQPCSLREWSTLPWRAFR